MVTSPIAMVNGFYVKGKTNMYNVDGTNGKTMVRGMYVLVADSAGAIIGCTMAALAWASKNQKPSRWHFVFLFVIFQKKECLTHITLMLLETAAHQVVDEINNMNLRINLRLGVILINKPSDQVDT